MAYKDEIVVNALGNNPTVDNPDLVKAVQKFVKTSLTDDYVQYICRRDGFDVSDLYQIYMTMLRESMPNPCMLVDKSTIAIPTLIFLEPERLEELFRWICADADRNASKSEWKRAIERNATEVAYIMKEAQDSADFIAGERPDAGRSGCLGVVFLLSFISWVMFY